MFNALFLDKSEDSLQADIRTITPEDLPEGEVLVAVHYSSLNYKDGLAVTGKGKIIRGAFPFIPGIDMVGQVVSSSASQYQEGDLVIQTGGGLGETTWGGFSQLQRVPAKWLVKLPDALTPIQSMQIGTAGFTAMLSVMALESHGIMPNAGDIVVTGASGGVGSIAIAILAHLGYSVVASSGSEQAYDFLTQLGASQIIHRSELGEGPKRALDSARWAGAVDTVGGDTLAAVISTLGRRGAVAACGNAGGFALNTTVFPFILRGVNLLGIDSNTSPISERQEAWNRLSRDLPEEKLDLILADTISLAQIPEMCQQVISGTVRGRVVVDVNA